MISLTHCSIVLYSSCLVIFLSNFFIFIFKFEFVAIKQHEEVIMKTLYFLYIMYSLSEYMTHVWILSLSSLLLFMFKHFSKVSTMSYEVYSNRCEWDAKMRFVALFTKEKAILLRFIQVVNDDSIKGEKCYFVI